MRAMRLFLSRLFAPVDISSLVFFRIAFGAILFWEVLRYFAYERIGRFYIDPAFHFTFYGFDWVRPWPGHGMYAHFYALGVLAICILLGLCYRLSAALFFLGFAYVFLLEQARYLNHFYLITLVSFLMIFVPAHRALSIDALLWPGLRSRTAPAWALWLLRMQIGIPYFYGGLAKLNGDWLRANPMSDWLAARTDFPLIGALFTRDWMAYLFSYSSLLLDLLVVPLLLWRRTRAPALAAAILFHLMNARLFAIGVFPWFMIAGTLLFLPAAWPRRLFRRRSPAGNDQPTCEIAAAPLSRGQRVTAGLLAIYVFLQLTVPLRHFLYPGNVSWTEQGHLFSWHMMLRQKSAGARFFAEDPASQKRWEIDPWQYLRNWQYTEMAVRPDMILQFCHHLARELRKQGYAQIKTYVVVTASLNGREPQLLVDPEVDLAAQPRTWRPAAWILPPDGPTRAAR